MLVTTRHPLTDHDALKLCRGRWLDERDPLVDADEAAWERRFALLLALLAPPGEQARRAG